MKLVKTKKGAEIEREISYGSTPPFNLAVKNKIARTFIKLVEKHFSGSPWLKKLFNKNNLKVSYSCTSNISNIINNHNKRLLDKEQNKNKKEPACNCRSQICPVQGKCLQTDVVYEAVVKSPTTKESKIYVRATQQPVKHRISQHKLSFRDRKYREATTLAKYLWELKEKHGRDPGVEWRIRKRAPSHKGNENPCMLFLNEKLKKQRPREDIELAI